MVRDDQGERAMVMMRWGMPLPPKPPWPSVTNIRNTSSPHWPFANPEAAARELVEIANSVEAAQDGRI